MLKIILCLLSFVSLFLVPETWWSCFSWQGEKECYYYMRTGSCKFGANCKFNHPDPTAGGGDSPSGYGNGSSVSLQGVLQSSISSWSSTRALNESTPFVPVILSANPVVSPQSSEWDGYQVNQ